VEIPDPEVTLEARTGTQVIPVAAIPVEVILAAEAPVAAVATQVEEIPAAKAMVRNSRRIIDISASRLEAVESLTIGPFEKMADRK
jgi:hypothetical protein